MMLSQLLAGADALRLALSAEQVDQLLVYLDLLQKWNRVYNLTAVRDPAEMLTHHLLDSLAAITPLRHHTGGAVTRLLDVGSGGGLPGVVIAITCPEIAVSCVDTVGKKAAFIQQAAATLKLSNLRGVHARVEALGAKESVGFDVVFARFCLVARLHHLVAGRAKTRWHLDGYEGQVSGRGDRRALPRHRCGSYGTPGCARAGRRALHCVAQAPQGLKPAGCLARLT
jgi:16S rRNA (guanine(527)-N(7))-methyltransferase RsmG